MISMKIIPIIVGELETNCYLLAAGREQALLDPGAEAEKILSTSPLQEGRLKYIILTHYHPDHTEAVPAIKAQSGGEILIHEAEKDLLPWPADRYLKEGDILTLGEDGLKVLHTPGHTPGGICLLGDNFIMTGDTLFLNGYGRTDLEWSSEEDMKKSLQRLEKIISSQMRVYPGHGPMSKISNS